MRLSSLTTFLRKRIFTSRASGLYLEGEVLRIAHVVKEGSALRIEGCSCLRANESTLLEKNGLLASGLGSDAIVFRTATLPLKGKRRVLAALPFQLENLLPFGADQLIAAVSLKTIAPRSTLVSIQATSKDALQKELDQFDAWGISLDRMTCANAALARLVLWLFPLQSQCIVLHVKEQKMHCVVVKEACIVLSQSISLNAGQAELERLALFIKEKVPGSETMPWVLLGSEDPSLSSLCQNAFASEPLAVTMKEAHTHTLPIGFALDALAQEGVQFLQKAYIPRHSLKAQKKNGVVYAASCAVLFLLFSVCSTLILNKKSHALADKYTSYFQMKENTQSYTAAAIQQGLDKLELSLNKTKNVSPFFPTIPNVSEVLSWLSTHPALTTADGLAKEGIEIKEVHYQLIKFPTLEESSLPYLAHVEIAFTATTPRVARDFHEALLKGDAIVNGKKDLKWNTAGNHYSAAFELSKKT